MAGRIHHTSDKPSKRALVGSSSVREAGPPGRLCRAMLSIAFITAGTTDAKSGIACVSKYFTVNKKRDDPLVLHSSSQDLESIFFGLER